MNLAASTASVATFDASPQCGIRSPAGTPAALADSWPGRNFDTDYFAPGPSSGSPSVATSLARSRPAPESL